MQISKTSATRAVNPFSPLPIFKDEIEADSDSARIINESINSDDEEKKNECYNFGLIIKRHQQRKNPLIRDKGSTRKNHSFIDYSGDK